MSPSKGRDREDAKLAFAVVDAVYKYTLWMDEY